MFTIKQNDTSPSIRATLTDASNTAIDLTAASVEFHMKHEDGTIMVNANAGILSANSGIVKYDWVAGDTSRSGLNLGEFQVTYPGGTIETFPNGGYIKIKIIDEIA